VVESVNLMSTSIPPPNPRQEFEICILIEQIYWGECWTTESEISVFVSPMKGNNILFFLQTMASDKNVKNSAP